MSEFILHNMHKGMSRLLAMPRDLPELWQRPGVHPALGTASSVHRQLFDAYASELARCVLLAMKWWQGRLASLESREPMPRRAALDRLYHETPSGPASHPAIIGVVRQYFLACESANAQLTAAAWIPPETFIVAWLQEAGHTALLEVVSGMLYWPLGLDADGHWV